MTGEPLPAGELVGTSGLRRPVNAWPARRVGDRLLCGRIERVSVSGGCRGEIGMIVHYDDLADDTDDTDEREAKRVLFGEPAAWVTLEDGMVEVPTDSRLWRSSKRARALRARGRKVELPVRRGRRSWRTRPELPFWRACPTCTVYAEVTADLL